MSTPVIFADLARQDSHASSIRFYDNHLHPLQHTGRYPGILGFYRMSDGLLSAVLRSNSTCDESRQKAFLKGKKVAIRVARLLNGLQTIHLVRGTASQSSRDIPFVCCGDMALVGGPPSEGHARDVEGISSYQEMEFVFPNISTLPGAYAFTSTQNFHFSCPSLKVDDEIFTEKAVSGFNHVEILSGVCLFSAEIIRRSILLDGRIDAKQLLYPKPTLYEMEYIARSSSAIADVASIIISRSKGIDQRQYEMGVRVSINLDLPSFHYYHSIHGKLEQGLISVVEAIQWIEAVERRHGQVSRVFESSVRHELARRGITTTGTFEIRVSPRKTLVSTFIRAALERGDSPSLEHLLQELTCQEDGLWRDFYSLLTAKEKPQDFRALGYLFYVFEVIRPTLMQNRTPSRRGLGLENTLDLASDGTSNQPCHRSLAKVPSRCLLISIDDAAERRIYSRAQKIFKKIRNSPHSLTQPTLVEVYMSRRVFINSNNAGSNLYLDDPTPEHPAFTEPHTCKCESGVEFSLPETLSPVDIVGNLYGYGCARRLQKLFTEVGL